MITATPRLKKLEEAKPVKRRLLAAGEIDSLLYACTPTVSKNAQELQFYIRFLVLTGAREQEALKVQWSDVDLSNQQMTIQRDTKNKEGRTVNFTPELKGLLHEMNETRPPDSSFLFPVTAARPEGHSRAEPARVIQEGPQQGQNAMGGLP